MTWQTRIALCSCLAPDLSKEDESSQPHVCTVRFLTLKEDETWAKPISFSMLLSCLRVWGGKSWGHFSE